MPSEIDCRFHAVYLLTSQHPSYRNHAYIGYTTNPIRRLRQHNGEIACGAHATSKKRPWSMVLFVSGFTEDRAGLRFEWMWQHPARAVALRDQVSRIALSRALPSCVAVLFLLLRIPLFSNMALTLNIVDQAIFARTKEFAVLHRIPEPVPSPLLIIQQVTWDEVEGMVRNLGDDEMPSPDLEATTTAVNLSIGTTGAGASDTSRVVDDRATFESLGLVPCTLCGISADRDTTFRCVASNDCLLRCHVDCLAMWFYVHAPPLRHEDHGFALAPTIIPVNPAPCPVCGECLHWPVLIQRMRLRMNRREAQILEGRRAMLEQRKAVMRALEAKPKPSKKSRAERIADSSASAASLVTPVASPIIPVPASALGMTALDSQQDLLLTDDFLLNM